MNEIAQIVRLFARRPNERFALATLVDATGSSYRRPGARMLIAADGERTGSISAGCLEDEVADAARDVIATGAPRRMSFDTRRRFGCSGSIEVFVERVSNDSLAELALAVAERRPFRLESASGFEQQIEPAIRLLIIGTGPDGFALAEQARLIGWEMVVLESVTDWEGAIDTRMAAVVATHNYGRDCAALRHLLPKALRYLGVIGPRRRRDEMLSDALDAGAKMTSQLFAPAGLHLAAETPAEIALSIVAEIQATFFGASAGSLCKRNVPIHQPEYVTVSVD